MTILEYTKYTDNRTPPLVEIYTCSLVLTNIVPVILLVLILHRLPGYVKTGDMKYLAEEHIGVLAILAYIFILLVSLMALIELYSSFS